MTCDLMTFRLVARAEHDFFTPPNARLLQKIQKVQTKEFPVGEPDWHGLPKLCELNILIGYIDNCPQ